MAHWRRFPTIYEINTWVWLSELSALYRRPLTLKDLPGEVWDGLADYGPDAVWLMGVWERSPAGIDIARRHPGLEREFAAVLPDYTPADVVGSPYSIRRYQAAERLGGPSGLATARAALASRGIRLLLDYVPNHLATDHPWVREHPEYFLQGSPAELAAVPEAFFSTGEHILAHGRDPYFPPWTDTAQVNAYHPGLRAAARGTLLDLARQCDGVRCDMAMLMQNEVFSRTWGQRAGEPPAEEFWPVLIEAVKGEYDDFLFVAETYWDMEWELQKQGFDFCYDKRLYDRLAHAGPSEINLHLTAGLDYQGRLVRFIENHDEPRAAEIFAGGKLCPAAVAAATLPGARLFHEGQFEGRTIRLPVQLGRRPYEEPDMDTGLFYRRLLSEIDAPVFHRGTWRLCRPEGWPDNQSAQNLLAWSWELGRERRLIVLNLSDRPAQGMIRLQWDLMGDRPMELADPFTGDCFRRSSQELCERGLFVDLKGCGVYFFHIPG